MKRRALKLTRRIRLRELEPPGERQEGMRNISTTITERVLCVRDLARLLVAIGSLDVEQALAKVAEWKRLEAMYIVDAEIGKRPLVRYVKKRVVS